jgi:hypothetical protein
MHQHLPFNCRLLLCLLVLFLPSVGWAQLALPLTEDFTASGTFPYALTTQGWTRTGTTETNPIQAVSPGLTYVGLSTAGGAAQLTTTGEDINLNFTTVTSGSVYASFLVNMATAQSGDYFFHFGSGSPSINTALF